MIERFYISGWIKHKKDKAKYFGPKKKKGPKKAKK
jgi:hypothetical protein